MHLADSEWHEWEPDGVTVRSFKATLDGSLITLRSEGHSLLQLEVPTKGSPWAESRPAVFEGKALVLIARRLDRQRTLCDLFEDGRGLRTGRTLQETRAIGVPKTVVFDPIGLGVLFVYWAPAIATIALVRVLFNEEPPLSLPITFLTVATCSFASLGASLVGRWALAAVNRSGHLVGLRTAAIAIGVLAFSFAVPAGLILGPMRPLLRH